MDYSRSTQSVWQMFVSTKKPIIKNAGLCNRVIHVSQWQQSKKLLNWTPGSKENAIVARAQSFLSLGSIKKIEK